MYQYQAFGFTIESELFLPQLKNTVINGEPDVKIRVKNPAVVEAPAVYGIYEKNHICFRVSSLAGFRITNGNLIEVFSESENQTGHLAVFLMGSCMGAILHQRGEMPLHGSCVTDGERAILLTGDSGAGKSTMASVFLQHGWKLLTDDVAVIADPEGRHLVQPSYPSQKLWEDSPEMNAHGKESIHSLYQREGKIKYGIDVGSIFCEEKKPLSMIVKLTVSDSPTEILELTRFAAIDQIMRNTYRLHMIMWEDMQRHFQRCVTLACNVPMVRVARNRSEESREILYRMITDEYQKLTSGV